MKKTKVILEINSCYVDIDKLSFVGQVETNPKPHLNHTLYELPLIIDGHKINIVFRTKKEAESGRRIVIAEIGATIKPELEGFTP